MYTESFNNSYINNLENITEELINSNEVNINDETFILVNDAKNKFGPSDENIYMNDSKRQSMIRSIDYDGLENKFNGNDLQMMKLCRVIDKMIELIENKFNETGVLKNDKVIEWFDVGNDVGRNKDRILTLILLMIYLWKNGDGGNFVKNLIECVFNVGGGSNVNNDGTNDNVNVENEDMNNDTINNVNIENDINNNNDTNNNDAARPFITSNINEGKYISKMYKLCHKLMHKCDGSNTSDIFCIMETFMLFKCFVILRKFTGSNKYINSELITDYCEICEATNGNKVFSNAILCSIYLWNSKYDWFDMSKFNKFLNKHGNIMKTLGYYVMSREKYNVLYALGLMYELKYFGSNDITNNDNDTVIKLNKINDNLIIEHNGAISIKSKQNNYIIELQNGQPIGTNSKVSTGPESIKSYIIYDVCSKNEYNVSNISYSIKDLIKSISQIIQSSDSSLVTVNDHLLTKGGDFKEMFKSNMMNDLLYIIIFAMFVLIVIISYYVCTDKNINHYKLTKYDKSLL